MEEISTNKIIEKEIMLFKEEQYKYDCYIDLSDEKKQAKYGAEYHRQIIEKLNKLAEYEKLEEEGKILKLPCKIRDTIYTVNNSLQQKPFEYEIELTGYSSHISEEGFKSGFYFAARQKNDKQIIHEFEDKDIDKTVFLSKKDAEKKLSEIKTAKLNNFER